MTSPVVGAELPALDAPVIHDPNEVSYGGSRRLFGDAAAAFGVELTADEYEQWRTLLVGACIIDHLADTDQRSNIRYHVERMVEGEFVDTIDPSMQMTVKEYMEQAPESEQAAIMDGVGRVGELADKQRTITSAHDLVEIRLEEAEILATLLALSERDATDSTARISFNDWLLSWSRAGYMFDSLIDMRKDYANHESGVVPTLRARLIVAAATKHEGIAAIAKTPPQLFAKCAMNGLRYVILEQKLQPNSAE